MVTEKVDIEDKETREKYNKTGTYGKYKKTASPWEIRDGEILEVFWSFCPRGNLKSDGLNQTRARCRRAFKDMEIPFLSNVSQQTLWKIAN